MIIQHKVKAGETLETIAKKYRFSDARALWNWVENKALKGRRKTPDAIEPGDIVRVPDVKAKIYHFKYGGKEYFLAEKEWEKFQKDFCKLMQDRVLKRLNVEMDNLYNRWKELEAIGSTHWFAIWFCTWSSLSSKERIAAEYALMKLETSVAKRDFKSVTADAKALEKAMEAYAAELGRYSDCLVSGSGRVIGVTKFARDGAFLVGSAISVTLLVPAGASIFLTACTASAVCGSAAVIKSVANDTGACLAGNAPGWEKFTENMMLKGLEGMAWGAAGGAIGRVVCGWMAKWIAKTFFKLPVIENLCKEFCKNSAKWGFSFSAIRADEAALTVAKLLIRLGVGRALLYSKPTVEEHWDDIVASIKRQGKAIKASQGEDAFCAKVMGGLPKDRILKAWTEKMIVANRAEIQKALDAADARAMAR